MDHEPCYVFKTERPSKRRRLDDRSGLDSSLSLRLQQYRDTWDEQLQRINLVIERANEEIVGNILSYLHNVSESRVPNELPAGFILAGPDIAAHSLVFEQLKTETGNDAKSIFISTSSSDAPNLKALLKAIIKSGTSQTLINEDETAVSRRSGRRLLDYDLQILYDHTQDLGAKQVIVAFSDCEAFDSGVLSEIISLLSLWSDRIPIVALFGVATSVENLQERISQNAVRVLSGRQFDAVQSDEMLENIFASITTEEPTGLVLGPQLSSTMIRRHHENLLSTRELVDTAQYAHMSHFFANPLSIFLVNGVHHTKISKDHFDAARNMNSFRSYAENAMSTKAGAIEIRKLLESNEALQDTLKAAISKLRSTTNHLVIAVDIASQINTLLSRPRTSKSGIYISAMNGEFSKTPLIRELLLAVKKSPSDILSRLLENISDIPLLDFQSTITGLSARLRELLEDEGESNPLRSEHDIRNDTLRTTIVAQKVQLSRHKLKLSEKDEAYSKIVADVHDLLADLFDNVKSPMDMLAHEIVVYDLRTPVKLALTPRPRFAVERALSKPHDYMSCQCCRPSGGGKGLSEDATLSATLPPTALLYQLYLESGPLINASDLLSAFTAVLESEGDNQSSSTMPLFQRALAELQFLGLLKPTRKKTDHLAKVAWRGL